MAAPKLITDTMASGRYKKMTTTFEHKLNRALLMEMPYVLWLDKPEEDILTIPGTDKSFRSMIDMRLERWARDDYRRISHALTRDGVVGLTSSGQWAFFRQDQMTDPEMRFATPEEINALEHLPDGWEENIGLDSVGQ